MTPAEAKIFAIRARLNGVWDNPALRFFGPLAATGNLHNDIKAILDAHIEAEEANIIWEKLDDDT